MSILSVKFSRKTPGLADGRARIVNTHKDSGVVTWIGTLAWRVVDGKLIEPTSYMIGNMVVIKEFDVSKQGMEGVSVAKGSVEEMRKKMNKTKGEVSEKIVREDKDEGVAVGMLGYEETEEKIKRKGGKAAKKDRKTANRSEKDEKAPYRIKLSTITLGYRLLTS